MVTFRNNSAGPIYIGSVLCQGGGAESTVNENDLKAFAKTPSGSFFFDESLIEIVDEDQKKKEQSQLEALTAQAMAKARQELSPIIEKEIREKLEAEYGESISILKKQIDDLTINIDDNKNDDEPLENITEDKPKEKPESKEFVFDPEKHSVEHRGGGNWFVMELEEKVYGPLDEDEKTKFESMLED